MRYPTRLVGDATLVNSRVVSTVPCKLVGIVGHNEHTADMFIEIFEAAAVPDNGTPPTPVAKFSVLSASGLPYSFTLPDAVDLESCTIVASSAASSANLTISTVTKTSIQAILAG